jgi:Na+-translocating ferredoxin:NAD+ oxidoreductase subunit B
VEHCTKKGTKSMFLIIRPDLCINCNSCNIAINCPEKAVDKVFIGPEDDFKGIWELEKDDPSLKKMDLSGRQG